MIPYETLIDNSLVSLDTTGSPSVFPDPGNLFESCSTEFPEGESGMIPNSGVHLLILELDDLIEDPVELPVLLLLFPKSVSIPFTIRRVVELEVPEAKRLVSL